MSPAVPTTDRPHGSGSVAAPSATRRRAHRKRRTLLACCLALAAGAESTAGTGASERCEGFRPAFSGVADRVVTACVGEELWITSETGLPPTQGVADPDRIMVGIQRWIQRVPIPFVYNWKLPMNPEWIEGDTEAASPRGPIAVAIDGVPIFHYEKRPDASTALADYIEENDTVKNDELDQCGGHSGQGEDYHYHYLPVCLLEDHDLSQPIAFGLDGAAIYFGEGGSAYYGGDRFSDWDNFPNGVSALDLDDCNAIELEDGSYAHYSTEEPPYLVGCHHATVDPTRQIEPRVMVPGRDQGTESPFGGELGEPLATRVSDFYRDLSGGYVLEFERSSNPPETSAVAYRPVEDQPSCWEFDFQEAAGTPATAQIACRSDLEEPTLLPEPTSGIGCWAGIFSVVGISRWFAANRATSPPPGPSTSAG